MFAFLLENSLLLTAFTLIAYFLTRHLFDPKRKNLPPGPWGVPLLGYTPFMPTDNGPKILQLFQKYGKIFYLRLGTQDVVFIQDFNVIKKITMKDVFNYRPDYFVFSAFPVNLIVKCEYLFYSMSGSFETHCFHILQGTGRSGRSSGSLHCVSCIIWASGSRRWRKRSWMRSTTCSNELETSVTSQ
jgi:hypothetical protein